MRISASWTAVAWLARDTFRQSLASGIGWLLLALSGACIVVCLSVSVSAPVRLGPAGENPDFLPRFDGDAHDGAKVRQSGVAVADGSLRLAFGAVRVPIARDVAAAVHFLQLILARGSGRHPGAAADAGVDGRLLAELPRFPRHSPSSWRSRFPARPCSWASTSACWHSSSCRRRFSSAERGLALAVRTGVWDAVYLRAVPLLLLHFAIFFSFSLLLAVCTRSTVVCVFGSIAFWGLCWAINFGRHAVTAASELTAQGAFSAPLVWLANVGYWLFPKPVDLGKLVFDSLGAGAYFRTPFAGGAGISLGLSVFTSLLFTAYILFAASRQFAKMDY